MKAGSVLKAAVAVSNLFLLFYLSPASCAATVTLLQSQRTAGLGFGGAEQSHLRPKNRAKLVRVPYSDSKRSSSGVRARILRMVWKMLRWMKGKVLTRYTISRGQHRIPGQRKEQAHGRRRRISCRQGHLACRTRGRDAAKGETKTEKRTCGQSGLFRYECAPSSQIPHGLDPQEAAGDNDDEDATGEEREAEDVRPDARGAEGRDCRSRHRSGGPRRGRGEAN